MGRMMGTELTLIDPFVKFVRNVWKLWNLHRIDLIFQLSHKAVMWFLFGKQTLCSRSYSLTGGFVVQNGDSYWLKTKFTASRATWRSFLPAECSRPLFNIYFVKCGLSEIYGIQRKVSEWPNRTKIWSNYFNYILILSTK